MTARIFYWIHHTGRYDGCTGVQRVVRLLAAQLAELPDVELVPVRWCADREAAIIAEREWVAGLARIHLRKKDPKLVNELVELANNDADDLALRKELAKRFTQDKDADRAQHWGDECLYVDVYDPECHTLMADAKLLANKPAEAVDEFDVALALKPKKPDDLRVKRAKSLLALGRKEEARAALDEVLKRDPDHPEARAARAEVR